MCEPFSVTISRVQLRIPSVTVTPGRTIVGEEVADAVFCARSDDEHKTAEEGLVGKDVRL
jgi:hypothetical protein